jgi:hypothetical protein
VRDEIVAYHDEIKDGLPLPSYVMDVVVFPDYSCHLIELNPFGSNMSSGAALFNWLYAWPHPFAFLLFAFAFAFALWPLSPRLTPPQYRRGPAVWSNRR